MNKQFHNYLKFKLFQQAHEIDKQHADYKDLKTSFKLKEETYQDIITYLQSENLRLLNFIVFHSKL